MCVPSECATFCATRGAIGARSPRLFYNRPWRVCAAAHRARGSYPPMVKPAAATLLLSFPSLTFS